ncbi:LuxR C-terminal-related transcriptional regulator [Moorella naiadis]|uniref:LuxR C-terminal-related transcriptional regulator n=1 Tax=Moorella naiadis (nom. illeg.) TaxID=3093670 RepID=UPI003D9C7D3D
MPEKVDARLQLSRLELQIALLSINGLKRWEIATVLDIQKGTVKSQLERVTSKLGLDWKDREDIYWPELELEVQQALLNLQKIKDESDAGADNAEITATIAALEAPEVDGPLKGQGEEGTAGQGDIRVEGPASIDFTTVRQALEGGLSPGEAAILQLQGFCSPRGQAYLRQARSTQWQLLLLGEGRSLYVSAGARFWLKSALAVLTDNRQIRFLQSDSGEDAYRPWWLPYTTSGRARGTHAAYYKLQDAASGEYTGSYLRTWIDSSLENYVAALHARMQQRWKALNRIARAAGRGGPQPLPNFSALLAEARRALGIEP